jgi:protein TonB
MSGRWTGEDRKAAVRRYVLVGAGLVALAGAVGWGINALLDDSGPAKKPSVQTIAVLRPPPPPPPPKPQEKPPEPEIKKEEVKLPEPEQPPEPQANNEPPPGEQLGVDAEGAGAGDGFGLQAKKGGRDITTIGEGGGGGGVNRAQFAFYTNLMQTQLQEQLLKNKKLRTADYRAIVRVWLAEDGRVSRVEMATGTGDADIDETIRTALADTRVRQAPPENMPQPVKLRLTSRGAG